MTDASIGRPAPTGATVTAPVRAGAVASGGGLGCAQVAGWVPTTFSGVAAGAGWSGLDFSDETSGATAGSDRPSRVSPATVAPAHGGQYGGGAGRTVDPAWTSVAGCHSDRACGRGSGQGCDPRSDRGSDSGSDWGSGWASDRRGSLRSPDQGTTIPLIMLCFLLAGTFVCGSIAASAAFLAQRELAGVCDGAAIAAANAFGRARTGAAAGAPSESEAGQDRSDSLPLDDAEVQRAATAYRLRQLPSDETLSISAVTDGRVATVTCRRRVRIPFGGLLGYGSGLDRTAVARARSPLD